MYNKKTVLFAPKAYFLRGWISVCAAALLVIAFAADLSSTIRFFIVLVAFFWGGELFIRGAFAELKNRYAGFNAFALVSAGAAFLFSIFNTFDGKPLLPVSGAAAVMPFIFICANFIKYFELKHIGHSRKFIDSLDGFISKSVFRINDDESIVKVFAAEVEIGDKLLIKTGERFAVDCKVVKGSTIVDENLLTGNITLAAKQAGDFIAAGSINKGPKIIAEAVSLKDSSKIAAILREVKKSETKKMRGSCMLELYAGKVLAFFIIAAGLQFLGSYISSPEHIFYHFVAALLILALSGSITYMAAVLLPVFFTIRNARKKDIFIQNTEALNILRSCDIIFIDKTGTLTSGRLEVSSAEAAEGVKTEDVLKAAYVAQSGADNIFAAALKEYARKNKLTAPKLSSIELYPSFGTVVKTAKTVIAAGRRNWLESLGVEGLPSAENAARTVFYVAKNGKYLGAVYFKDRLRANVKSTIAFLKEKGKKICLLSGDNGGAVAAAAKMAGIEEYYSAMYPQDKAGKISAAENLGSKTVMLGDGFNDILALLQARAGVAFGSANNVFSSWVDIIVKDRDFSAFKKIFDFERCRHNVIKQNVYISVFSSVFVFWEIFIAGKTFAWYDMLLAVFFTVLIITVNSARISNE